jgi:hypothetical protein
VIAGVVVNCDAKPYTSFHSRAAVPATFFFDYRLSAATRHRPGSFFQGEEPGLWWGVGVAVARSAA